MSLKDFDEVETAPYSADLGPVTVTNRTTVRLRSSRPGTISDDGHLDISVVLRFDHSFDAPFVEEDSDLAITLTTRAPHGSPLDGDGRVTLIGDGTFSGGVLDGRRAVLTYTGRVSPPPW